MLNSFGFLNALFPFTVRFFFAVLLKFILLQLFIMQCNDLIYQHLKLIESTNACILLGYLFGILRCRKNVPIKSGDEFFKIWSLSVLNVLLI